MSDPNKELAAEVIAVWCSTCPERGCTFCSKYLHERDNSEFVRSGSGQMKPKEPTQVRLRDRIKSIRSKIEKEQIAELDGCIEKALEQKEAENRKLREALDLYQNSVADLVSVGLQAAADVAAGNTPAPRDPRIIKRIIEAHFKASLLASEENNNEN